MLGFFDNSYVLVTGGAGFIGSHIVDRLMELGAKVKVLDDLSSGSLENLSRWRNNPNFELINGDIRNPEIVKEAVRGISVVFHQAAKVSVPFSIENPTLVADVNGMGTVILLDECRKADMEKVVVASSSSVYGETSTLPKIESMITEPISPYGVSKLTAERMAIAFAKTYNLNTTTLRYFNIFGPRQRGGSYAGVISIFINNGFTNQPFPIFGDGTQTRDFTFVRDVVDCNIRAAMSEKTNGEVYNVAGGQQITINRLGEIIKSLTGSTSEFQYLPKREGDIEHSLADISKAQRDFGYEPTVDIESGLKKTIEWMTETRE
ncbi:MAG: SDR family NAD(P)-dependent oxidoreductase [Promethearchaeota archaeon]